jgi:hypothetical protein
MSNKFWEELISCFLWYDTDRTENALSNNYSLLQDTKESEHWLNQISTSNRYTSLLEEESENQQHKAGPENTQKPPPICITEVKIPRHSYSC